MTVLDDTLVPKIKDTIAKYGKKVIFTVDTNTFDPATGLTTTTSKTYTEFVTPPQSFDIRYVNNDLIRKEDLLISLAAKSLKFTPAVGMKITIDSKIYRTVALEKVYTGDLVGMYNIQLRE